MTISTRRPARILTAVLVALLSAALLTLPALTASPAEAKRPAPQLRKATPPNVHWPVASKKSRDLGRKGRKPGTEIAAGCRTTVRAAHPGTAVVSASRHSGPHLVRIVTSSGGLTSWYGYMKKSFVTSGQIIQAGQRIGKVGREGRAKRCALYFAVTNDNGNRTYNPSRWLKKWVGKPMPTDVLFGSRGFVVASFNVLGASHTRSSNRYPTGDVRMQGQVALLNSYGVDVGGLQEFQTPQRNAFAVSAGSTFGVFPAETDVAYGNQDRENSIIWRQGTMEFVEGHSIDVPYFNGMERPRKMPVVLLRHRETGRTAYFINVHNPASGVGYGNQTANRRLALAIERNEVVRLRATGRPVFLMGDFNDRKRAFCGLTTGMLMITPDSIPSTSCAPPAQLHIDWVFPAGPARFTRYARDWRPKDLRLSDHPMVWTRTHLSE